MSAMELERKLAQIQADIRFLLNKEPSFLGYSDRKQFQKIAYLLKKWGLDYGYTFLWHYAGPFSYDLHFDYYEKYNSKSNLPVSDEEKLTEFKAILDGRIGDVNALERLASILYLNDEYSLGFDESKLIHTMKLQKPQFEEEDVRKDLDFLKNKFLASSN